MEVTGKKVIIRASRAVDREYYDTYYTNDI